MKKTIIFAALLALVACDKEIFDIANPASMVETNGIKVNLTIARSDGFGSTKATVKSDWADNDVVFVFFKGIAAPKYIELKYNGGSWTSTAKNDLSASDFTGVADKQMTAIYLPYGSSATVAASEGNFIFSDLTYSGYFLQAEQVTYSYEGGVLSGTLNMSAPALSSASDKLIHFDVSGFTSGHNYKLYQDYVKPLTFTSVSAEGIISKNEGTMGTCITGYEDGSMLSFSGILDASAVGNTIDYKFTIDDKTSCIIYTRDAGTKTVNSSKYIGIGAINNDLVWSPFEYIVDLGLSVKWAAFNVGAIKPEEYGDYYAWGDIETYYEDGYASENPQEHWKSEKMSGYNISSYRFGKIVKGNAGVTYIKITKYCDDSFYGYEGYTDTKTILDLEDDVASVKWGGSWRMPTYEEFNELHNNCTWTRTTVNGINGYRVTSNIPGYTDQSIFLPAAGLRGGTLLDYVNTYGRYWSSSFRHDHDDPYSVHAFYMGSEGNMYWYGSSRIYGFSIRPVCP